MLRVLNMKEKLNVTVEPEIVKKIDKKVASGEFRNRSHVVEFYLEKIFRGDNQV